MKLLHWLDENLEKVVIVVVTSLMVIILAASVFSRYVVNISISWAEELSIFGMMWLCYFGVSYAAKLRRHIRISIIPDMLPPKPRKVIEICVNIVFILFMIFLIYGTIKMTVLSYETGQAAPASGWPRWIAIVSMPIAFALTCIRLAQDTVKMVGEYKIIAAGGTVEAGPSMIVLDEGE